MASLPSANSKIPKIKIDIPYNRPAARLRRAIASFIKIFLLISIVITVYMFVSNDEVISGLFASSLTLGMQILQNLIVAVFFIGFQFGMMFWFMGRAKMDVILPGDDNSVTFRDYYGQPKLVGLVKQWMSLLRDRKAYEKMGGKYISGLLLYGPPGTGKTMLAKAVAGESGMPFVAIEGTGLLGVFMGMDILKVLQFSRKVKKLAKKYGACVAYIDEIDAIGTSRGAVMTGGGGRGAEEATGIKKVIAGMGMGGGMGSMALSTLLSQMDGINEMSRGEKMRKRFMKSFGIDWKPQRNWHVMWMGSTNRPDVLDPALVRSGRMDTHIAVLPPDKASRRLVIEGYLKKIKTDDTIDIESIVADTISTTPADIMTAITKNSVRIAFFDGRQLVSQKDIDKAFLELMHGMEMPIEEFSENQRRVLAYHEAGHAVAQYYMMPEQKIVRVTIVRLSNGAFGHMAMADTVEQHIKPIMHYAYDIIVGLAGRGSEKIYTGEMFASVGGDYPFVAAMIQRLTFYGFFGPSSVIDGAMKQHTDNKVFINYFTAMEQATEALLRRHWKEVSAVAEAVLIHNTLSGKEVVELIETNQSPGLIDEEEIIPNTLASIRARAIAESRRLQPSATLELDSNGVSTNGHASGNDTVVIINGAANGAAAPPQPKPATPVSDSTKDASEPRLVNRNPDGFQPPIVNDNNPPPPEPKPK